MPEEKYKSKIIHTRLVGHINYDLIKDPLKAIDEANEKPEIEKVVLTIVSGGGFFYPSFALFDHIKASKKPVDIIAAGNCMSCAVMILQAGRKRLSYSNTVFMVHPSHFNQEDNKPFYESMKVVDQYKINHEKFIELTITRSGISKAEFEKLYNPIKYFTPKEALSFGPNGLIDEILT